MREGASEDAVGDLVACIAEDDADIRAFVAIILRRAGFRTLQFGDGQSALDCAAQAPADVYVIDVRMPGLTGMDVCRRLRADPATRDSRILLMSAETTADSLTAARDAGADDYLPKPFSRAELLRRIGSMLDHAGQGD